MKIIQSSDYRIYFDDVRMDPYIKSWSASCGLNASDATANLTMYRTKELEKWKGYLTQVRIFALNVFSGKYCIVFEGEITNRSWSDARVGAEISFACQGFYHWLNIPIPLIIDRNEKLDKVARFEYEAQNINVDEIETLYATKADLIMKDKPIKDIVENLFEKMYSGYYLSEDSTFAWAKLKERVKIMGDVVKEFRDAGYLDILTFIRTTQIESFYVYLNNVLTQLMFEFYQDRDGAIRVKGPSWKDSILKAHVIDESVVQSASGFNDWANEPTRVLIKGGTQDVGQKGSPAVGIGNVFEVPMGLYIGAAGEGEYFSQNIRVEMMFGTDTGDYIQGAVGGSAKAASYYLDNFRVSTPFSLTDLHDGYHPNGHKGVDFARPGEASIEGKPIYAVVGGTVSIVFNNNESAGNAVRIKDAEGREWAYNHMKSAPPVSVGDTITAGQVIGEIGSTGNSSGPHLDLKILQANGEYTDPIPVLKAIAESAGSGESGDAASGATGSADQAKFINQDLKNQSNWSADQLNKWINSKAQKSSLMYNQGAAFYEAAQKSGLDPIYLVSHAAHETGWGTSSISKSKGNFFGIGAFDSSPAASAFAFDGVQGGIVGGAVWIRENYYDKGQTTLYTMRYSSNGKHNFATDTGWANKIADIMMGAGAAAGVAGSSGGGPNALTGGYTVKTTFSQGYEGFGNASSKSDAEDNKAMAGGTSKASGYRTIARLPGAIKNADHIANTPTEYKGPHTFRIAYPLPKNEIGDYIRTQPNGVEHGMIGAIIEVSSNWKEKAESAEGRVGLMGIPKIYYSMQPNVDKAMLLEGQANILHGTQLFANAYKRFTNKCTFALASLYLGDMTTVEEAIKKAGAEDFTKVRLNLDKGAVAFVDKVIDVYVELYGADYIKGDPHIPIFTTGDMATGEIDKTVVESPEVKDYESSYKPIMSDEERLYKVNLKISEQVLIRYDMEQNANQIYTADEMVERYAKYMMQLYRAESHGLNISLSTCMPFLRPGFNAWFEPTRRNVVFYITKVSHQGSYGNGAFSTVSGGFVRDPKTYDKVADNIFVSKSYAKASDFGEVVGSLDELKSELVSLHKNSEDVIGDARTISTLNKLYSSATAKSTDYSTTWTEELSSTQIETKIKKLYEKAPDIVKKRKKSLKGIVDDSADFFTKMLLKTSR